jgi:hypothetical protein
MDLAQGVLAGPESSFDLPSRQVEVMIDLSQHLALCVANFFGLAQVLFLAWIPTLYCGDVSLAYILGHLDLLHRHWIQNRGRSDRLLLNLACAPIYEYVTELLTMIHFAKSSLRQRPGLASVFSLVFPVWLGLGLEKVERIVHQIAD